MKVNRYIGIAMMAAGMFAATSCSDFSDYNEVVPDATPSANLTLWENIQQNSNLSDFATLVKAVNDLFSLLIVVVVKDGDRQIN